MADKMKIEYDLFIYLFCVDNTGISTGLSLGFDPRLEVYANEKDLKGHSTNIQAWNLKSVFLEYNQIMILPLIQWDYRNELFLQV